MYSLINTSIFTFKIISQENLPTPLSNSSNSTAGPLSNGLSILAITRIPVTGLCPLVTSV